MADLGATANAFAVVGLADIVFRTSTDLYELLTRCRSASKSASQLLFELRSLSAIVAQVRIIAAEEKRESGISDDGQALLKEVEAILGDCERELGGLREAALSAVTKSGDGWLKQWVGNLGWALDDQRVAKACQQLERHKTALIAAHSVIGRHNALVIRAEVQKTRDGVEQTQTICKDGFQKLGSSLETISTTVSQDLDKVCVSIQAGKETNERTLSKIEATIAGGQRAFNAVQRQQESSTSRVLARIDDVESNLSKQLAALSLPSATIKDVYFEGPCLDRIVLPLMLMQTNLVQAVKALFAAGKVKADRSDIDWIQDEFDHLLVCSHEAAAKVNRDKSYRPNTLEQETPFSTGYERHVGRERRDRYLRKDRTAVITKFCQSLSDRKSMFTFRNRYEFKTETGKLIVDSKVNNTKDLQHGMRLQLLVFRFSMLPRKAISKSGVSIMICKHETIDIEQPRIARMVQSLNVISNESRAVEFAQANDVRGLRKLFTEKKASPFDYDQAGNSLLYVRRLFLYIT